MNKTLIEAEKDRMEWSLKTFTEATPESSLKKLEEEVKEIRENFATGKKDAVEFADAIMCLFDSAGRFGITAEEIQTAYAQKVVINKARIWKKNSDNTYSHIKRTNGNTC